MVLPLSVLLASIMTFGSFSSSFAYWRTGDHHGPYWYVELGFSATATMRRNSRRLLWAGVISLAAGASCWIYSGQPSIAYFGNRLHRTVCLVHRFCFDGRSCQRIGCTASRKPASHPACTRTTILGFADGSPERDRCCRLRKRTFGLPAELNGSFAGADQAGGYPASSVLPATHLLATAADAGRSEFQERTLVLSPRSSGEIDSQLVSSSGETLDSISRYCRLSSLMEAC